MNKKILAILLVAGLYFAWRRPTLRDLSNEADILITGKTCGERNNNPGNIRRGAPWKGATGAASCGTSGIFVVFSSPAYGIRAIGRDLLTKYGRGLNTIRKIITVYAPPSENNTAAYIKSVENETGFSADEVLNLRDTRTMTGLVYAIIRHENGRVIYSVAEIAEGVSAALSGG